jgi:DNA-directed RNA polymerase specialized sigma24 family protein
LNKLIRGDERSAALAALSPAQKKQLATYARIMSGGTGDEGTDLLQEAFARWLGSDKPVEGPDQTRDFLRGAIKSIRYNILRHKRVVLKYEGVRAVTQEGDEEDPLDGAADPAASTEGPLFVQQVYDLCGDDEEVRSLLIAQVGNASPDDILAELKWDEKKYKAVQKRKRRLVIRLTLEGKLK